MATSGSYDFSVNRNELLAAAYRTIGLVAEGDNPTTNQYTNGAQALNMMIKAMQGPPNYYAKGLKMWRRSRVSLTLQDDTEEYSLKASGGDCDTQIPVKIVSALLRNSDDEDVPLREITFEEYEAIGDKLATKTPTKFYYERDLDQGRLFLDGYADDTTSTVEMVVLLPLEDMDAAANDFDFAQEWYEALKYNLAVRLAVENGIPISDDLRGLAQISIEMAGSIDQEVSALYFQPKRDDD